MTRPWVRLRRNCLAAGAIRTRGPIPLNRSVGSFEKKRWKRRSSGALSALINASDDGIVVVQGTVACASARQDMSGQIHQLSVDHSERHSALLEAARRSGAFDVRMVHLDAGDYLIDDEVLVERREATAFNPDAPKQENASKSIRLFDKATCSVGRDLTSGVPVAKSQFS